MNNKIYKRIKKEAGYMLETNCTIRELAKVMNVSKSTVHKDLHDRLKEIDSNMYDKINKILQYHIEIRHLNGGEATRIKYLKKKR